MRKSITGGLAALVVLSSSLVPAQMPSPTLTALVNGSNQLGFDLTQKVAREGNAFFSPASIASALLMAHAGAKGETASEIAAALHISDLDPKSPEFHDAIVALVAELNRTTSPDDIEKMKRHFPDYQGPLQLSLVNAFWGQRGHPFRQDFIDRLSSTFGSELHTMDFGKDPEGSRKAINDRIAEQTQDRIQDLMPAGSVSSATLLVLTNAIYFKNQWQDTFSSRATKAQPFYSTEESSFEVPMMVKNHHFGYAEMDGARAVALPYADGRQSMIVVLPTARHGLAELEKAFTAKRLAALQKSLKSELVALKLPKFKITESYELAAALKALGVNKAFDAQEADLSGMDNGAGRLVFDRVIHKSFVAVDENGTEAAAATALALRAGAAMRPAEPRPFVCDEPFLFFIVDRPTQMVLFQGRCVDPR